MAGVVVVVALLGLAWVTLPREGLEVEAQSEGRRKAVEDMTAQELLEYAKSLEETLRWHARYREEEREVAQAVHTALKGDLAEQDGALVQCHEEKRRAIDRSSGGAGQMAWATAETRDRLLDRLLLEEEEELRMLQQRRSMLDSALLLSVPLAKPYFFVHLAKTGGTSLITSVQSSLPRLNNLHFWRTPPEETAREAIAPFLASAAGEEGAAGKRKLEVLMGHVSYGAHEWWPREEPLAKYTYFTILRNPVDRVVSHYRYHLSNAADPNHKHAIGRSLSQWVKDVKFGQNAMTAFLSGYQHSDWWNDGDPELPLMRKAVVLPEDEWRQSDGLVWPGEDEERGSNCTALRDENYRVTYGHYKKARRNLLTMLVGIQEEYDTSIEHFNAWLKIGDGLSVSHRNTNTRGEQVELSQIGRAHV